MGAASYPDSGIEFRGHSRSGVLWIYEDFQSFHRRIFPNL
jgi:hypothetical protein